MKYHLGGDMSKHLAPNGKPSNLTHEQWHLVRTPEFKAWFGDWENDPANASKVVDENGEPLVVYHGTQANFNKFKKQNTYFTNSKKYIKKLFDLDFEIKEVFLSSKKVLDLSKLGTRNISFSTFSKECFRNGAKKEYASFEELEDYVGANKYMVWQYFRSDEIYLSDMAIDWLGYFFDVIVYENSGVSGVKSKTFLFISNKNKLSTRIKLADGTNTTFDGSNADIRFDDGGEVNSNLFMMWYKDWYNGIYNKMFIAISLPNAIQPFKEKNAVILDVFSKKDQNIDENAYLKEIVEKADEYSVVIYVKPKHLVDYYGRFGFQLTPNKQFMKRLPHDIRYKNGGTMKKVDKGGITYGKSHDEGGIPVKNASTGQMLEVEGGEGIVNKRSMASDKKVKMNGKEMTICEAVSHLNQMEGGVKFSCDDVEHRQFIEAMELGGELEQGKRTEKEHIETLVKLYQNRITPNEAITEIAKEHIAESPTYYSDLEKTMNVDAQSLQDSENIISIFSYEEKNYPPYESSDLQIDRLTKYKLGGELKSSCGCNHTKKYMDGGIFGGGIEALESFADDSNKDKYAEKCVRIISSAREILNQDLKAKLLTSKLDSSLHKYFVPFNKINLYDDGWRFAYGESKQWAGLCASHGLEQDRGKKTLYLSVDFAKYDVVFEEHFEEVVYHEMAHALVFEYIVSKIGKQAMMQIDPLYFMNTPEQPIGHGQIWKLICSVLDADCDVFYRKAKYGDSFEMFKYECKNCGQKKYGNSRNFAEICFRCFEAVSVIKNNE